MQEQSKELPPHSEDVQEEQSRIELALEAVYSSSTLGNPTNANWYEGRQLADRYLTSFQSTKLAWIICDRLLSAARMEQRFFAAQTLHRKCRSDVWQLPEESLPSLRDSLLHHLLQATGESTLLTRLSLCVAALSIQMAWSTIVTDLTSNPTSQPVALSILQVLPEECASDRVILEDETLRYVMRDHLISSAGMVMTYRDFGLWLPWIRYVPMPAHTIIDANIVPICLQALPDEKAVDVVVEILRLYPSHVDGNRGLAQTIRPMILSLPLDEALQDNTSEDAKRAYCRIFTELGESHLSHIFEEPSTQIVSSVLRCSSISDTSISSMTFQFWYHFVAELHQLPDLRRRQELVDLFASCLLPLLDVCLNHLQYPEEELSSEESEEFHRERYYLAETVEDCCRLLGGQMVLERVGQSLMLQIQSQNASWQSVEASLYAMQPLAKYVPSDEATFLPHCFPMILQLPRTIEPLRFTANLFVGKYASWLSAHPDQLHPLLPYLAEGLSTPKVSRASALAIKELCENIPLGESVIQLYEQVCGKLELRDELEILEGVCKGVSLEEMTTYLQRIIQPIGSRFQETLQQQPQSSNSSKAILWEVERLTVVVRFLPMGGSAVLEVMQSMWILLETAGKTYASDSQLAEKLCRLHKHALRTAGLTVYAPMIPRLIGLIVNSFQQSHQSPYIYLASIIVTECPHHPEPLMEMLTALCQTAFSFLQSLSDMIQNPDVVEELFYCMGRMLKHCPEPLVRATDLMKSLMQCSLVGMELEHRDANRGTLHFLERAASLRLAGEADQALKGLLMPLGPSILQQSVRVFMEELPSYHLDGSNGSIAGILFALRQVFPEHFPGWASEALLITPERPRQEFLAALQQEFDRQEFELAVRAFSAACERYRKLGGNIKSNSSSKI